MGKAILPKILKAKTLGNKKSPIWSNTIDIMAISFNWLLVSPILLLIKVDIKHPFFYLMDLFYHIIAKKSIFLGKYNKSDLLY